MCTWWSQVADGYYAFDEHVLLAQPATPLRPRTRYLFVATDGLRAADGGPVRPSAETRRLLAGEIDGAYEAEVDEGLAVLEGSLGVPRSHVVVATSFTTATVHDAVLAMAKAARAAPDPPVLLEPWTVETPLEEGGRIRFRAVFEAPEYRRPQPVRTWEIVAGAPVVQKKVGLEVFLAFANGAKSGPRPVVIYGHGLGGDKDGSWGTAERLRDIDAAVIAIDSPEHGSRSSNPDSPVAATFSFFGIDEATQSFDIRRARDNFRQMASDQLELVRLIESLATLDLLPEGAPDGVPDLDTSRILYIGHSFGSVQGPTVLAIAPEIRHAVWNVGGAGLMTLLRDSPMFSLLVNALKPAGTADGTLARFFAMTQALVDAGDPLSFARYGTLEALPGIEGWSARDVLLQEVVGDTIVPNSDERGAGARRGPRERRAAAFDFGRGRGRGPALGQPAGRRHRRHRAVRPRARRRPRDPRRAHLLPRSPCPIRPLLRDRPRHGPRHHRSGLLTRAGLCAKGITTEADGHGEVEGK